MSGSTDNALDDEILVELLAAGATHRDAAARCGISSKTIQRRLKDEAFARRVLDRKRSRVAAITSKLTQVSEQAVTALVGLLDTDDEALRLKVATTVLDLGRRYFSEEARDWEVTRQLDEIAQGFAALTGVNPQPVGDDDV